MRRSHPFPIESDPGRGFWERTKLRIVLDEIDQRLPGVRLSWVLSFCSLHIEFGVLRAAARRYGVSAGSSWAKADAGRSMSAKRRTANRILIMVFSPLQLSEIFSEGRRELRRPGQILPPRLHVGV